MPMRQLIVIGTVLLAAACGKPRSTPGEPAANTSEAVQLGGPPTGAGTSRTTRMHPGVRPSKRFARRALALNLPEPLAH